MIGYLDGKVEGVVSMLDDDRNNYIQVMRGMLKKAEKDLVHVFKTQTHGQTNEQDDIRTTILDVSFMLNMLDMKLKD